MKKKMMSVGLVVVGSLVLAACGSAAGAADGLDELNAALAAVQDQLAAAQDALADQGITVPEVAAAATDAAPVASSSGEISLDALPQLGATKDEVVQLLGNPRSTTTTTSDGSERTNMNWDDPQAGASISVTVEDGYVNQVSVDLDNPPTIEFADLSAARVGMSLDELTAAVGVAPARVSFSRWYQEWNNSWSYSSNVHFGHWNSGARLAASLDDDGISTSISANNFGTTLAGEPIELAGLPALGASMDEVIALLGNPDHTSVHSSGDRETTNMDWSDAGIHVTLENDGVTSIIHDMEGTAITLDQVNQVRLGMTFAEVTGLLGAARSTNLNRWYQEWDNSWSYSTHASFGTSGTGSMHVTFDDAGVVIHVSASGF